MASILYAYCDGEWRSERFQSLGDARRAAYLGEKHGALAPVRIDAEKYYKGRTEVRKNWTREPGETFVEWADAVAAKGARVPTWYPEGED